jgi:hypothetical protein
MRLLLIFLAIFALVAGMAGAQWYPRSADYNTSGDVNAANGVFSGTVTATGGITGTASRVAIGSFIDTAYGLKNSTANKAQVNISADMGLRLGTGATEGSIEIYPGDGIDVGASGLAVDATDIVDQAYGIDETTTNNIGVNLTTNDGMEFGTGANLGSLGVKTGDGLDTGATGVLVDATDIINTGEGLYESTENNIAVNLTEDGGLGFGTGADSGALIIYPYSGMKTTSNGLEINYTADKGLEIGTGAAEGSLQIELDGYSLAAGASGLKLNASDAQEVDTIAVNDADGLTVNGQIVPVYETLVIPINNESVDEYIFVADDLWYLVKAEEIHVAAGTESAPIAANLTIRICDDGEDVTAGLNSTITPIPLDSAANTFNTASLNSSNIAIQNGDMIAFDYAGTLTGLRGSVTLTLRRM